MITYDLVNAILVIALGLVILGGLYTLCFDEKGYIVPIIGFILLLIDFILSMYLATQSYNSFL